MKPQTTNSARFQSHISPMISTIWSRSKLDPESNQSSRSNEVLPYQEIRRTAWPKPKQGREGAARNRLTKKQKSDVSYRNSYVYNAIPRKESRSRKTERRKKTFEDGDVQTIRDYSINRISKMDEERQKHRAHSMDSLERICRMYKRSGISYREPQTKPDEPNNDEDNEVVKLQGEDSGKSYSQSLLTNKISASGVRSTTRDAGDSQGTQEAQITESTESPIQELIPLSVRRRPFENNSACENGEKRCDHACAEEYGHSVCTCFEGFLLRGTRCIGKFIKQKNL